MGYTENINSILKWGNAFQRQFGVPLDRSSLFGSYEDALAYAKGDASDERKLGGESYIGQIITVWGLNEKGKEGVWVYSLVPSAKEGYKAELKSVGAGAGTETADKYSDAVELSKDLVIGQLIWVFNEEEVDASGDSDDSDISKIIYKAGFYIVNSPGSISALDTSTGASDEIGAIRNRVETLEGNRVLISDFNTYKSETATALGAKVDDTEFAEYQGTVSTALDAKVDDTEFAEYQGTVSTALDAKVDDTEFAEYKGEVTTALGEKATVEALNNLDTKVEGDIKNLSEHLVEFSGAVNEIDGRLNSLEDFVNVHVEHDAIETSDIEGLFTPKAE
jgi:archaellum component FlaC